VLRQHAKPDSCAKKVMHGGEIAKTPLSLGHQLEFRGAPHTGTIHMHELDMLGKDGRWNRCTLSSQRVLRRNHLDPSYRQQSLHVELRRRRRQGSEYANGTAPVEHRIRHGLPHLNVKP
jgi:hypothetical protein